jgi:hypothetical protein
LFAFVQAWSDSFRVVVVMIVRTAFFFLFRQGGSFRPGPLFVSGGGDDDDGRDDPAEVRLLLQPYAIPPPPFPTTKQAYIRVYQFVVPARGKVAIETGVAAPHLIMTYCALLALAILRDDYSLLDRAALARMVGSCQGKDGG